MDGGGDTSARFVSQPMDHHSVVGPSSRARDQGRGNGVLTAELKSRKRRFGPGVSAKWKTHFWVARSADRTIHLYKNDLASSATTRSARCACEAASPATAGWPPCSI